MHIRVPGQGGADRVPGLGGLMASVPHFPRKAKIYRIYTKPARCFTLCAPWKKHKTQDPSCFFSVSEGLYPREPTPTRWVPALPPAHGLQGGVRRVQEGGGGGR